jgi:hypothetical protein
MQQSTPVQRPYVDHAVSMLVTFLNESNIPTSEDINSMRAIEMLNQAGVDASTWLVEDYQAFTEEWLVVTLVAEGMLPGDIDNDDKVDQFCGMCHKPYKWSAEDVAAMYEVSAFMPCGCNWKYLNKYVI